RGDSMRIVLFDDILERHVRRSLGRALRSRGHEVVETPAIWVPARNEVMWRVAPVTAGSYILEVRDGAGHAMTKTLVASDEVVRRSPVRVSGFWWQIAFPAEPPLPADGPFEEASLPYPDTEVSLFGWELQWLYVFLILTIVFGFALRGPMKVTF
ncbi:MAG: hypothetical protein R3190_14825, partial [Thermoanaerobaculia bacterium]|nr:hypothetical protein [Thermoanaerobaculia bacterium]